MNKALEEKWEVIPQAPNYSVSNYGEVVNNLNEKQIHGHINDEGFRVVHLVDGKGRSRSFRIHLLVAQMFLVDYRETNTVTHKGAKSDNSVRNLQMGGKHAVR